MIAHKNRIYEVNVAVCHGTGLKLYITMMNNWLINIWLMIQPDFTMIGKINFLLLFKIRGSHSYLWFLHLVYCRGPGQVVTPPSIFTWWCGMHIPVPWHATLYLVWRQTGSVMNMLFEDPFNCSQKYWTCFRIITSTLIINRQYRHWKY